MAERDGRGQGTALAAEMETFLAEWARASVAKDVTAASALRTEDYRASYPDNRILLKADELAGTASPDIAVTSMTTELLAAESRGDGAMLRFDMTMRLRHGSEEEVRDILRCEMNVVRGPDGLWQARRLDARRLYELQTRAVERPASFAVRVARRLRSLVPSAAAAEDGGGKSFQELAYQPYRPKEDYVLPPVPAPQTSFDEAALPVPPVELWLGYNYLSHGGVHVRRMLDIVAASGFEFGEGDRIMDLGCGAGRMIRHLAPLAERCEIWGSDISAEHIFWCKRHLSPPFRFLTNTKVPHLPFADGSFRFIYCGSLFTHIDDLADAWLIELRRLLAPGGRLFVTIHDEQTMALFDQWQDPPPVPRAIRAAAAYAQAKAGFDMFTVGRDNHSQVFYARDYFARMTGTAGFDLLSVTPEAYFYQTAVLLEPR